MPKKLRRPSPPARALLLALAVSASAVSCEMSSGFLSDSERNSLYSLAVSASDGSAMADGVILLPGTGLAAIVTRKTGASDPASLDFSLASLGGAPAAALRLASAASAAEGAASKSVARIDGKLEGLSIPADLALGAYVLSVSLSGADGAALMQETFHIFVGASRPVIDSVSTFPPSVEPGSSVLLGLSVSWLPLARGSGPAAAPDPWIRWSKDSIAFAEGLLSSGLGKVVWSAPRSDGAYSIRAEVFPTAPPKGASFAFKASASQDLKVMVISSPGGSGNDFADPLAFYSLLSLDGSFDDSGTRPRTLQPKSFGSPALDTYSSGFGYRFGPEAGVSIPGLMPPSASGRLGAFSLLLRLDSGQEDGALASFVSDDGSYALVFGIKDMRPYVETAIAGKTARSVAALPMPRKPLTLEAVLEPDGERLTIAWRAEGERIDAPSLPLPPAPPAGSATLGGPGSLPGVYDGFGLMAGSSSPTYRLAARRRWKASLLIAESFEDGALPALAAAKGGVSAASGALELEPGGSLLLAPAFGIASTLVIEADIEGDRASCALVLSSAEGDRVLAVGGDGEVSSASGKKAGRIDTSGGRIAISLEPKDGTLLLRGADGGAPIAVAAAAKRFAISLERSGGSGRAAFARVLVRSSASSARQ
jgi:hypothetical protein